MWRSLPTSRYRLKEAIQKRPAFGNREMRQTLSGRGQRTAESGRNGVHEPLKRDFDDE
jgi:hypothetical protein